MRIVMKVVRKGGIAAGTVDGKSLVQHAAERLTAKLADATLAAARPNVPVDLGVLRDSGHVEPVPGGARVVFDAEYAPFVHGPMDGSAPGTEPHWPPWSPGTPLADWAERHGIPAFLVARKISQAGTRQYPFLTDAVNDVMAATFPQLGYDALEELRQALTNGTDEGAS